MISTSVLAEGDNKGLYLAGSIGTTKQAAAYINNPSLNFGDDIEDYNMDYATSSAYLLNIGYGFRVLHLEGVIANLGDQGFKFGDIFEYKREVKFAGVAARWLWKWFSVRAGLGQAFIKASNKDLSDGAATVDHDLDTGSKSYFGSIFSLGLQIPVSEVFQLYLESNGIAWAQDDGQLEYAEGDTEGSETLSATQSVNIIAVGVRFYL